MKYPKLIPVLRLSDSWESEMVNPPPDDDESLKPKAALNTLDPDYSDWLAPEAKAADIALSRFLQVTLAAANGNQLAAMESTRVLIEAVQAWRHFVADSDKEAVRGAVAEVLKDWPIIPALWNPQSKTTARLSRYWDKFRCSLNYPFGRITKDARRGRGGGKATTVLMRLFDYVVDCGDIVRNQNAADKILKHKSQTLEGAPYWFIRCGKLEPFGCDSQCDYLSVISGALDHSYKDWSRVPELKAILPPGSRFKTAAAKRDAIRRQFKTYLRRLAG